MRELFVEKLWRSILMCAGLCVRHRRGSETVCPVLHALGDHQAIDAIGGEIFHVAVEEAGAAAVEHAIAIADYGAHGGARSGECALAYVRAAAGEDSGIAALP